MDRLCHCSYTGCAGRRLCAGVHIKIDVLRLFGPMVVWLALFSSVYGMQDIACEQGWSNTPVMVAWVLGIAVQAAFLPILHSARFGMHGEIERWTSQALEIIAVIGMIWTLFPVVLLKAWISGPTTQLAEHTNRSVCSHLNVLDSVRQCSFIVSVDPVFSL